MVLRELRSEFIGSSDDEGEARQIRDGCARILRSMALTRRFLVQMKPARGKGVGSWYEVWLYEFEAAGPGGVEVAE